MRYSSRVLFPVLACMLTACTEQSLPVFDMPLPISVPSGTPAYGPRLVTSPDGEVILSWMERGDDSFALRFSVYEQGSWGPAATATTDAHMFVNWADLPAVTPLDTGSLLAHWLSYTADAPYAYQILTAQSADKGASWSTPASPHADGTPTEHGFVSTYPAAGATGLVWLDGRQTPAKGMTLRSATLSAEGVVSDKTVIDDWVCDCCQTDVAITAAGPIAAYRNRTADEVRDIYVARNLNGQWQPGSAIADDGWVISGCPVNGPAIDAAGQFAAIAWFTAANQKPKVQTAFSTNAGKSFSEAIEIASPNTTGHVGVALLDRHAYVVSWMEPGKNGDYAIKLRAVTTDGQTGKEQIVGRTSVARNVPQLIRIGDKLLLAWTDTFDDVQKVAAVEVAILGLYD